MMIEYFFFIRDQLGNTARDEADLLIKENPGMTRFEALAKFVQKSFKSPFFSISTIYGEPPRLVKEMIRDVYAKIATDYLDVYSGSIGRRGPEEYKMNEVAWIRYGSEKRLAVVEVDYYANFGESDLPKYFIKWISKDAEKVSIDAWLAAGLRKEIRTFDISEIEDVDPVLRFE